MLFGSFIAEIPGIRQHIAIVKRQEPVLFPLPVL
jgi:hypothetical protein